MSLFLTGPISISGNRTNLFKGGDVPLCARGSDKDYSEIYLLFRDVLLIVEGKALQQHFLNTSKFKWMSGQIPKAQTAKGYLDDLACVTVIVSLFPFQM